MHPYSILPSLASLLVFASTLNATDSEALRSLFGDRGFDPASIQLPGKEDTFPTGTLENVAFKTVASLEAFPEGPSFRASDGSYFFSGNVGLTRVDSDGGLHVVIEEPGGGGTHFLPDGSVLLIGKVGLRRIYPDGRIALLADGEVVGGGNDITMGKDGEIYFSAPGRGIYRLTPGTDGTLELVTTEAANGLEVDPSGEWLYTAAGGIQRHRIHGIDQPLGDRELVCALPKGEGGGDGCTFDVWGNFYSVHFKTGKIRVVDPVKKAVIAEIQPPVTPAANLTFGGPGNTEVFLTAGVPKLNNCQVLKADFGITGFPGHPGATEYPEIRILEERADAKAFAAQ